MNGEKTIFLVEVDNSDQSSDPIICDCMRKNKMKCTRQAVVKLKSLVGLSKNGVLEGTRFCAEHLALLKIRAKEEGFEVVLG